MVGPCGCSAGEPHLLAALGASGGSACTLQAEQLGRDDLQRVAEHRAVQAEPKLKWGLQVPPGKATGGGGWSFTVPVGAQHSREGRDFVLWFVEPDNLSRLQIREPARISATTSPPWNSDEFKIVFKAAKYSHILPPIPQWTEIQTMIITELQKALQGTKTPQAAVNDMASQANAILGRK